MIRVLRGKGDKDRIVLFGRHAAAAEKVWVATGFLFEAPARTGQLFKNFRAWYARFYVNGEQREVWLGRIRGESHRPGRGASSPLPFRAGGQGEVRADESGHSGLHGTSAHALRCQVDPPAPGLAWPSAPASPVFIHILFVAPSATHMLAQRRRPTRDSGFARARTRHQARLLYTNLSAAKLVEVHKRCHPHAEGGLKMPREKRDSGSPRAVRPKHSRAARCVHREKDRGNDRRRLHGNTGAVFSTKKDRARDRKLQTRPQQQKWSNCFAEWGCIGLQKKGQCRYEATGMCANVL